MDPNLFRLDWAQVFEVVAAVVVMSFLIERSLAMLFEHRLFIKHFEGKGIKEPIAFVVSLAICITWDFDLPAVVLTAENTSLFGQILTAALIAGGSKASIKLFKDLLGVQSTAAAAAKQAKAAQTSGG